MATRRRIICLHWMPVAIGAVLTISALTASAQGPRGVPEPYTPAKDARDLKAVLFNWERNMGMLKGHDERDMVAMLEHQGKGTIQVAGQPCTLTKYRASTNLGYTVGRWEGDTLVLDSISFVDSTWLGRGGF